jgi:hypothetical protein
MADLDAIIAETQQTLGAIIQKVRVILLPG